MTKLLKKVSVEVEGETQEFAVIKDGKPVYVDDKTNQEFAIDAANSAETIARLNLEAKNRREEKEAAEAKLALFGDLDADAAKSAIETVKNLESGDLLKADKVAEIKREAIVATENHYKGKITGLEAQVGTLSKEKDTLTGDLHNEKLTNAFATSKYVNEKLAIHPSMAQSVFGKHFKIENGKLMGYDNHNSPIASIEHPGDVPTFDEMVAQVVEAYPHKESIMRGNNQQGGGGGGNGGNGGRGGDGAKTITRKEFDRLSPVEQRAKMAAGYKPVDA